MNKWLFTFLIVVVLANNLQAQYPYGDHWYQNPLGFKPLNLHTSMGFFIPAVAAGTCLLLTNKDTTLKHKLALYNEIGLSWGYKSPYTSMPSNNLGINYQIRRFLSIGAEFDLLFPRDNFNSTSGFAIRPFARFYTFTREKWRLYFESGGGFIYTLKEFPLPTDRDNRRGLRLNGITKYGIGGEVNIHSYTTLMFGIRHLHISNGNAKGVDRNPSHDSNGFFVGVTYKLK